MKLQKKKDKNIIHTGRKFLTIHMKCYSGKLGSEKTNTLLKLINHQQDIDEIFLKDIHESKHNMSHNIIS